MRHTSICALALGCLALLLHVQAQTGQDPAVSNVGCTGIQGVNFNQALQILFSASPPSSIDQLIWDGCGLTGNLDDPQAVDSLVQMPQLEKISLNRNSLQGSIPAAMGSFSNLTTLMLAANNLTGSIPADLGKLGALQSLILGSNQLTGVVPATLANLSKLTYLSLANNNLGFDPSAASNVFDQFQSSISLDLGSNNFTGDVVFSLGNFARLSLSRNYVTSIAMLGTSVITALDLSYNRLSSLSAGQFGTSALSSLSSLDLSYNSITGTIPSNFTGPNVTSLKISGNSLNGSLPSSFFASFPNLVELYLQDNVNLGGAFPDLPASLVTLTASNCSFESLGQWTPQLATVDLSNNRLKSLASNWDSLSVDAKTPSSLKSLVLHDNQLTWKTRGTYKAEDILAQGTDFESIATGRQVKSLPYNLPSLEILDLSNNPINADVQEVLSSVVYLPALRDLECANCALTGSVVTLMYVDFPLFSIGGATNGIQEQRLTQGFATLQTLVLSGNSIKAVMWKPSPQLKTADFSNNALSSSGMAIEWFNVRGSYAVAQLNVAQNPSLQIQVQAPASSGCSQASTSLIAQASFTNAGAGLGFQCSELCSSPTTSYSTGVLDPEDMCRCLDGWQGQGQSCTGCPADSFSFYNDTFAMRKVCLKCPAGSSSEGKLKQSSVCSCLCAKGSYLVGVDCTTAVTPANPSLASCVPCPDLKTTAGSGALSVASCTCDTSLGLRFVQGGGCACPTGQILVRNSTGKALRCQQCETRQYAFFNDTSALSASVCLQCPSNGVALSPGASICDCQCPVGTYLSVGFKCAGAGRGTYSPLPGENLTCVPCPDLKTSPLGTLLVSSCACDTTLGNLVAKGGGCACPTGQILAVSSAGKACQTCEQNQYASFTDPTALSASVCLQCPSNGTALSPAASICDCQCPAGTFLSVGSKCAGSGRGAYLPQPGEVLSCLPCPDLKTSLMGALLISACACDTASISNLITQGSGCACPTGQILDRNSAGKALACRPCEQKQYAAFTDPTALSASVCLQCPSNGTALSPGGSICDCQCPLGTYLSVGSKCAGTGRGSYSPSPDEELNCAPCPDLKTTAGIGELVSTACTCDTSIGLLAKGTGCACPTGQILVRSNEGQALTCQQCGAQEYAVFENASSLSASVCLQCPSNGSSLSPATSICDCKCPAGTYLSVGSKCAGLGRGTYLPQQGEGVFCKRCPLTTWSKEGALTVAECTCQGQANLFRTAVNGSYACACSAGYLPQTDNTTGEVIGCTACGPDTYSLAANEGATSASVCQPCPPGSTTNNATAQTSVCSCLCPIGLFMSTNATCPPINPAALSTFTGQCQACRDLQTTPKIGALKIQDCTCNPNISGLMMVSDLLICRCGIGQYYNEQEMTCKSCVEGERCDWGNIENTSLVLKKPRLVRGYWAEEPVRAKARLLLSTAAELNRTPAIIPYAGQNVYKCYSNLTCIDEFGTCAAGREGKACSLCKRGYSGGPEGPCEPCQNNVQQAQQTMAVGVIFVGFFGTAAFIVAQKILDKAKMKALVELLGSHADDAHEDRRTETPGQPSNTAMPGDTVLQVEPEANNHHGEDPEPVDLEAAQPRKGSKSAVATEVNLQEGGCREETGGSFNPDEEPDYLTAKCFGCGDKTSFKVQKEGNFRCAVLGCRCEQGAIYRCERENCGRSLCATHVKVDPAFNRDAVPEYLQAVCIHCREETLFKVQEDVNVRCDVIGCKPEKGAKSQPIYRCEGEKCERLLCARHVKDWEKTGAHSNVRKAKCSFCKTGQLIEAPNKELKCGVEGCNKEGTFASCGNKECKDDCHFCEWHSKAPDEKSKRVAALIAEIVVPKVRLCSVIILRYVQVIGVSAAVRSDIPFDLVKVYSIGTDLTVNLWSQVPTACLAERQTASLELFVRWLCPPLAILSAFVMSVTLAPAHLHLRKRLWRTEAKCDCEQDIEEVTIQQTCSWCLHKAVFVCPGRPNAKPGDPQCKLHLCVLCTEGRKVTCGNCKVELMDTREHKCNKCDRLGVFKCKSDTCFYCEVHHEELKLKPRQTRLRSILHGEDGKAKCLRKFFGGLLVILLVLWVEPVSEISRMDTLQVVAFIALKILFNTLVANGLSLVTCVEQPSGQYVVNDFPHIECPRGTSRDTAEFYQLLPPCLVYCCVFLLVVPVSICFVSWKRTVEEMDRGNRGMWEGFGIYARAMCGFNFRCLKVLGDKVWKVMVCMRLADPSCDEPERTVISRADSSKIFIMNAKEGTQSRFSSLRQRTSAFLSDGDQVRSSSKTSHATNSVSEEEQDATSGVKSTSQLLQRIASKISRAASRRSIASEDSRTKPKAKKDQAVALKAKVDALYEKLPKPAPRGPWAFLSTEYRDSHVHFLQIQVGKDLLLNVIASVGASDPNNRMLALAALNLAFATYVLVEEPFIERLGNTLEAFSSFSVGIQLIVLASKIGSLSVYYGGFAIHAVALLFPVCLTIMDILGALPLVQRWIPNQWRTWTDDEDLRKQRVINLFKRAQRRWEEIVLLLDDVDFLRLDKLFSSSARAVHIFTEPCPSWVAPMHPTTAYLRELKNSKRKARHRVLRKSLTYAIIRFAKEQNKKRTEAAIILQRVYRRIWRGPEEAEKMRQTAAANTLQRAWRKLTKAEEMKRTSAARTLQRAWRRRAQWVSSPVSHPPEVTVDLDSFVQDIRQPAPIVSPTASGGEETIRSI